MGMIDRLFKRSGGPDISRRPVPELAGAMNAHQTWAVAAPAVRDLDRQARLILITSGLDMNAEGRSHCWEFVFFLSRRHLVLMIGLAPDPAAPDVDHAPCILSRRSRPATDLDATRPAFPGTFRDSPEAVAELSTMGVDIIAGPSDMKLEGRVSPSGEANWVTYDWDEARRVPFSASDA